MKDLNEKLKEIEDWNRGSVNEAGRRYVPLLVKALRHAMKNWGHGVEADITAILN